MVEYALRFFYHITLPSRCVQGYHKLGDPVPPRGLGLAAGRGQESEGAV